MPKPPKVLILSHVFFPDNVATAAYSFDLAKLLAEKAYSLEVWTADSNYENPKLRYPKTEVWPPPPTTPPALNSLDSLNPLDSLKLSKRSKKDIDQPNSPLLDEESKNGRPKSDEPSNHPQGKNSSVILIRRLGSTRFSKRSLIGRAINFFSFNFNLALRLFWQGKKWDLLIVSSSPPFLACGVALFSKLFKVPFFFWDLDLQPELAIASGLFPQDSWRAKFFFALARFSLTQAKQVMVLDRFMQAKIEKTYGPGLNLSFSPLWPLAEASYSGDFWQNPFRQDQNLGTKVVLIYAGNHALVHPLQTLLETALLLKQHSDFCFLFIGEGVRKQEVSRWKEQHQLTNLRQLPFLPRDYIHISLAAADFQVVPYGDNMVGLTHPQKIYGAMFADSQVIYIGPSPSHISELLPDDGNIKIRHGEQEKLKDQLLAFARLPLEERLAFRGKNRQVLLEKLPPDRLKQELVEAIARLV